MTAAAILIFTTVYAQDDSSWQKTFGISNCNLLTTGQNQYFILVPGHQLVLEEEDEKVQITVLNETKAVAGVITRVVEEREWRDGNLYEVSRNYFAICEQRKDVLYFGEDVDFYKDGKVVRHEGAWLAGTNGNRAGLIMPGTPKVGMKYYQEIAPGVAMDRAEIISLDETCKTPAGTFSNCMKVKESTPLEVGVEEYKYYAPGIGLIQDEDLILTKHGTVGDGQ
jgi:hypothetical protein